MYPDTEYIRCIQIQKYRVHPEKVYIQGVIQDTQYILGVSL